MWCRVQLSRFRKYEFQFFDNEPQRQLLFEECAFCRGNTWKCLSRLKLTHTLVDNRRISYDFNNNRNIHNKYRFV